MITSLRQSANDYEALDYYEFFVDKELVCTVCPSLPTNLTLHTTLSLELREQLLKYAIECKHPEFVINALYATIE